MVLVVSSLLKNKPSLASSFSFWENILNSNDKKTHIQYYSVTDSKQRTKNMLSPLFTIFEKQKNGLTIIHF